MTAHILVLSDSHETLKLLDTWLTQFDFAISGYSLDAASRERLRIAAASPDVIIMSVTPRAYIEGLICIEQLRTTGVKSCIPVVVVSAADNKAITDNPWGFAVGVAIPAALRIGELGQLMHSMVGWVKNTPQYTQ